MSTHRPPRMMTIRRWLVLALAALFLTPFLTAMVIGFIVFGPADGPREIDQEIVARLTRDAGRWSEPAWQNSLLADYGDDADIVLMVGDERVFTTGDPMREEDTRLVRQVVMTDTEPERVAWIYSDPSEGPPEELRRWYVPLLLIGALVLTLAAIAWFLRRSVVRPLEAASTAARRIAHGDLDVSLPSSRVREINGLVAAFESMSAGLRASLARRTAMEQERKLLITAIAHDLRTPIFSLRGSLQGLRQGIARTPEQQERYLDIALDKADQLEHLVADLFAFTRMEYMGDEPKKEPVPITPFLRGVADSARPTADEKGVGIQIDAPAAGPSIEADPHLLTRALGNILDNAIRYAPDGGTIQIACQETPESLAITVTDSGPGFAPDDIPHLFEPLYRGEASRSRKTGGAGLGLTIAHRIITAHGGTLTATNAETGGAMLTITLPRDSA